MMRSFLRPAVVALAISAAPLGSASAHHGWSWTVEELSEMTGTVRAIYLGNPHAALDVEVDGEVWKVELAPPSATERAGFTEDAAAVGDSVTVLGNRSRDPAERRMKAVRITLGDQSYDIYPSRVPD